MKLFILTLFFLFETNAQASGIAKLTGKIIVFSGQKIILETPMQKFTIDRAKLGKSESSKITKADQQVSLSVPFEAIDRVVGK